MRIKLIFYVVFFTYMSLFFIMNGRMNINLNFIFMKKDVSFILIFFISFLLGVIITYIFCSRKVFHLKKAIRELKSGHENKKK